MARLRRRQPAILRAVSRTDETERPIFLVGMMGAGKSTIGRALARRLGRDFVDLDEQIAARAGRSIPEIFERQGEAGFRAMERDGLREAAGGAAVVALGGGTLTQPGAASEIGAAGRVVYLRASVEQLLARLGDGRGRPLLAGLDAPGRRARIAALLAERAPAYERADLVVDVGERAIDDVVAGLADALGG